MNAPARPVVAAAATESDCSEGKEGWTGVYTAIISWFGFVGCWPGFGQPT